MNTLDYLLLADSGAAPIQPAHPLVLGISGQFFTLNSQPWTAIESSEFSLYKRHFEGDIRPVLQERSALGFNLLRVWLLNTSVIPGGLHPRMYQDFYSELPRFAALLASFGFCVEFTAFTQTKTLMPSKSDQHLHWQRIIEALYGAPNVLLELVNEADQHDNATDPSLLQIRPSGIIASSGSNGADSPPPQPVWDYVLYHSNGLNEWQRKVGHNTMEPADIHHCPGLANENTRYPDQDSSDVHAEDAAEGAALLCAGSCFHSQSGKVSRLFDDAEFHAAAAWVRGAESVPLEFQRGTYIHRQDLEGPTCIRAYERRLHDGRGHIVRIRP